MGTEQEYYQNLANRRSEDRQRDLSVSKERASVGASTANTKKKGNLDAQSFSSKEVAIKAKSLALAFTAIDLEKDAVHFVVIMFSLIADLLTFIPFVGWLLAIPFACLIWILYAFSGYLKKNVGKKAVTTAIGQASEVLFGVVGFGFLPFYTITAGVNFWFAVADRKEQQDKAKEAQ